VLPYTYRSHIYAGKPTHEPTAHYLSGVQETVTAMLSQYSENNELKGRNLTFDR
jgi:hypothetical protein